MCNACGFGCCGYDSLDGCGCDCDEWKCRSTHCGGCGQIVDLFEDECACWSDDYPDDEDNPGPRTPSIAAPIGREVQRGDDA